MESNRGAPPSCFGPRMSGQGARAQSMHAAYYPEGAERTVNTGGSSLSNAGWAHEMENTYIDTGISTADLPFLCKGTRGEKPVCKAKQRKDSLYHLLQNVLRSSRGSRRRSLLTAHQGRKPIDMVASGGKRHQRRRWASASGQRSPGEERGPPGEGKRSEGGAVSVTMAHPVRKPI